MNSPTADQNQLYDEIYEKVVKELEEFNEEDWSAGVSVKETVDEIVEMYEERFEEEFATESRRQEIRERMIIEITYDFKGKIMKDEVTSSWNFSMEAGGWCWTAEECWSGAQGVSWIK